MDEPKLTIQQQRFTNRCRLPRFKRASKPPPMKFTNRDGQILQSVFRFGLLTRKQIERLHFKSSHGQSHSTTTSRARLRLKLLFHNGYLERMPLPVALGAWAWEPVYRLDSRGAEKVALDLGRNKKEILYWGRGDHKDKRPPSVTHLFLEHALSINDFRIAVVCAAEQKGFQVEKWLDDRQLKSQEYKDYVLVSDKGKHRSVAVIPDAYFALNLGERRAHFLLELDRATMPNSRWKTRVNAYLAYIRSGNYSERYKTRSLRILTATTTEERLWNLKETTRKAGGGEVFWFTTIDKVTPESVLFAPIWRLANDERDSARKVLIE